MKAEIYLNGPISCGIVANDAFFEYKGGILKQFLKPKEEVPHRITGTITDWQGTRTTWTNTTAGYEEKFVDINYEVTVVGWGQDAKTGQEYWIGKSYQGTFWGEQGFFRIGTGDYSLAMETQCHAGIPSYEKNEKLERKKS